MRGSRLLDEFDGLQQVLSLANPPIELLGPPDQTPELARIANDALAELCRKHPDRFPAFIASMPMNNVEACAARDRPRDRATSARAASRSSPTSLGKPLSAPEFRPIFQAHGGARPAGLGPSDPRAAVCRLRERESLGERDLVHLRLALRDHGLHDAADLLGDLRRAAGPQDHHPPHGRHDPVLRRQDRSRLPPDLLRHARSQSGGGGGRAEEASGRVLQDALCRHRAQRRGRADALRPRVLRHRPSACSPPTRRSMPSRAAG